jgi:hypothetical protein
MAPRIGAAPHSRFTRRDGFAADTCNGNGSAFAQAPPNVATAARAPV